MVTLGSEEIERYEVVGTAWVYRVDDQNFSVAAIIENERNVNRAKIR